MGDLPPSAGKEIVATLERLGEELQLHLFATLGHKSDVMVMALSENPALLRRAQTEICRAGAPALTLVWSYVSLTETSEYTPTAEQHREDLAAKGVSGEDLDRRVEKFRERMAAYNRDKLYPDMPAWEVAGFYPMSHRREGDDNWYSLPFDDRRELMHDHGRSGRAFTGRVLQLVTGSTGLDDWEWGVTLFAHRLDDIKDVVYTLRFDEASARFAEFGPFVVGLRRSPAELVDELGLPGSES
ncbi:MAG: chlorite dismutase family protein [Nitriliruptorales bacterium]|nr:chlorite dismutase family protein [Nitriliruptorales bacterium]